MPRRPRVNLVGHPQHVVQCGHNREACFFAEEDYQFYLHWLRRGACKYGCTIHAYALIANHINDRFREQAAAALGRQEAPRRRGRPGGGPVNAALPGQRGLEL